MKIWESLKPISNFLLNNIQFQLGIIIVKGDDSMESKSNKSIDVKKIAVIETFIVIPVKIIDKSNSKSKK